MSFIAREPIKPDSPMSTSGTASSTIRGVMCRTVRISRDKRAGCALMNGVNFTKAGAEKLGHYVEHDLRRVLTSHVLPVALPGPEEQPPASDNVAGRPAIGPVVPRTPPVREKGGQLLGAASHPEERPADPLATRVLNRGEAFVAPRGRADDFTWPRPDVSGAADTEPVPGALPPGVSIGMKETRDGNNKLETVTSGGAKSDPVKSSPAHARPPLPVGPKGR